jgi:hypothetical protein
VGSGSDAGPAKPLPASPGSDDRSRITEGPPALLRSVDRPQPVRGHQGGRGRGKEVTTITDFNGFVDIGQLTGVGTATDFRGNSTSASTIAPWSASSSGWTGSTSGCRRGSSPRRGRSRRSGGALRSRVAPAPRCPLARPPVSGMPSTSRAQPSAGRQTVRIQSTPTSRTPTAMIGSWVDVVHA